MLRFEGGKVRGSLLAGARQEDRALGDRHLEAGEGLGVLDDESKGRDDLVGRADEGQIVADGDALSARLADRVDVELADSDAEQHGAEDITLTEAFRAEQSGQEIAVHKKK